MAATFILLSLISATLGISLNMIHPKDSTIPSLKRGNLHIGNNETLYKTIPLDQTSLCEPDIAAKWNERRRIMLWIIHENILCVPCHFVYWSKTRKKRRVQSFIQIKHHKNRLNSKIYVQLYLQTIDYCSLCLSSKIIKRFGRPSEQSNTSSCSVRQSLRRNKMASLTLIHW